MSKYGYIYLYIYIYIYIYIYKCAKADAIGALQQHEDNLQEGYTKLKGVSDQLSVLHQDCDWFEYVATRADVHGCT